jgi:hypothetical protein
MNRIVFAGLWLVVAPCLSAQQNHSQPTPVFPADSVNPRQLIAWTWMQDPKPVPQPLPAEKDDGVASERGQNGAEPQGPQRAQTPAGASVKDADPQHADGQAPRH